MNIITCQNCGWNYEYPMHTTVPPNCPRCFPVNYTISTSTTTDGLGAKKQRETEVKGNED